MRYSVGDMRKAHFAKPLVTKLKSLTTRYMISETTNIKYTHNTPIRYATMGQDVLYAKVAITERGQSVIKTMALPRVKGKIKGVSVRTVNPVERDATSQILAGNELVTSKFYSGTVNINGATNADIETWLTANFDQEYVKTNLAAENLETTQAIYQDLVPNGEKIIVGWARRFGIMNFASDCFGTDFYAVSPLTINDPETNYSEEYLFYISYNEGDGTSTHRLIVS